MTQHEIKDYLGTLYGLDIEYVKTTIYPGKVKTKTRPHPHKKNVSLSKVVRSPGYKSAVVTLRQPAVEAGVDVA